jgi:hypothetical protein
MTKADLVRQIDELTNRKMSKAWKLNALYEILHNYVSTDEDVNASLDAFYLSLYPNTLNKEEK